MIRRDLLRRHQPNAAATLAEVERDLARANAKYLRDAGRISAEQAAEVLRKLDEEMAES